MGEGANAGGVRDRRRLRVAICAALLAAALACAAAAGCGSAREAAAWLAESGQAVEEYAAAGGYLHFRQEMESVIGGALGELSQVLRVEGDIVFPEREAYGYEETLSISLLPGEEQRNAFSYLTLDGGATAYVMGERLSAELGVEGWIRYTPAPGQNRYFDYALLAGSLLSMAREPEWLGYEEEGGTRCAHLRYVASGEEALQLHMQRDPSLAGQYLDPQAGGLGELTVQLWIGEEDKLPRRASVEQEVSTPDGVSGSTRAVFTFSGYGEGPARSIEAPAAFHEAV